MDALTNSSHDQHIPSGADILLLWLTFWQISGSLFKSPFRMAYGLTPFDGGQSVKNGLKTALINFLSKKTRKTLYIGRGISLRRLYLHRRRLKKVKNGQGDVVCPLPLPIYSYSGIKRFKFNLGIWVNRPPLIELLRCADSWKPTPFIQSLVSLIGGHRSLMLLNKLAFLATCCLVG